MPDYIVNVNDPTTPTNQQGAKQGAEELRNIKSKLLFIQQQSSFWNPDDTHADLTLTSGFLGVLKTANAASVGSRGTTGKASGKWYWENTVLVATGSISFGIGLLIASLAVALGINVNGWAYRSDGNKVNNGTVAGYGATFTVGDVIAVAWDADADTLTFYKNNISQGVAYNTGLGGTLYAMVSLTNLDDAIITNFGATPFTYTPPAGFGGLATPISGEPVPFFVKQFYSVLS